MLGRISTEARVALTWALIALAAIAAALLAKHLYDRSVIAAHEAGRAAQAIEARDQAAEERAADATANAQTEKDLHDAIDAAPSTGALSPAALALNCERLRKIGRTPAACGSPRSDRSQADPGR